MIGEALAAYAKSTTRHFDDRANTVGGSEIGQCERKVYFAKNEGDRVYGVDSDENFVNAWGAPLRGRLLENNFWLPALRARFGDKLLYAGEEQRTLASGFLSATPDGLLIEQPRDLLAALGVADLGGDGSVVVEAKSIDPRARLEGPKHEHRFQVIVQLGLFREATQHKPQTALISYMNASFPDEVNEFAVSFDRGLFEVAKKRATKIMTATQAADLSPEGWIAGGRECEHCPFTAACGVIRHAVPTQPREEEPDPQFVAEIADLARQAKKFEVSVDAATAQLRSTQHEIKERLRAKDLRRVTGDGVSVIWSPVKGRGSYDMRAIREAAAKAGVDLTPFETTGNPTDRLVIQLVGQSRTAR